MEIKVDQEKLQSALDDTATEAVMNAMQSYEVTKVIREQLADKIVLDILGASIAESINKLDMDTLTEALSKQLSRNITSSVSLLLEDAIIQMMFKLRGYSEYDNDAENIRAKIRAELKQ